MTALLILSLISSLSFLAFGGSCLGSGYMRSEFERYGLSRHRKLVGILELAGGAGLLVGIRIPLIGLLAALGLTLLMLLGFLVRLKIRDGWIRSSPALAYMLLNAYLCAIYMRLLMAV